MKIYQSVNGEFPLPMREYDIAAATQIKAGQVVKIVEGLVVKAAVNETGAMLGIAAENHTGAADVLNPRANGTKIKVYDSPLSIFKCKAPVFTASGGTATTVTADELGAFSNDNFNGGYLVLVKKAAGSTNTDKIGAVKKITDYSYNSTGTVSTFTVASGGTAADGDEFMLLPPVGFRGGNFDTAVEGIVVTATAQIPMKVVGLDAESGELLMLPAKHLMSVGV